MRGSSSWQKQLGLGDKDLAQAFRRMVFNYMARNCDDHTKNTGFLMKMGKPWELAPAYDLTHSYKPGSIWVSEHQMSVNGKFSDLARSDFLTISDRYAIPSARDLIDEVAEGLSHWKKYADTAGVPPGAATTIEKEFQIV